MGSKAFAIELARDARAPRAARRQLAERFAESLREAELETAALLASELATNAVQHGQGRILLRADLDEDRLLVEVIDEGAGLEQSVRVLDFENVRGSGLRIVDAAASRWGAYENTSHVWFELERPGPRLGAEKMPAQRAPT